jgi:hypothetical protein
VRSARLPLGLGIHHHVADSYSLAYGNESAWRENNRRISNGE